MSEIEYKRIAIPRDMIAEIKRAREENPSLGYTSDPEFIKDAIREKLRGLNKNLEAVQTVA